MWYTAAGNPEMRGHIWSGVTRRDPGRLEDETLRPVRRWNAIWAGVLQPNHAGGVGCGCPDCSLCLTVGISRGSSSVDAAPRKRQRDCESDNEQHVDAAIWHSLQYIVAEGTLGENGGVVRTAHRRGAVSRL